MFPRFEMQQDWAHLAAWAGVESTVANNASIESVGTVRQGGAHSKSRPVVRISPAMGHREVVWMREGLIPSYACDERGAEQRAEAQSEAMTCDSCFRSAFRRRRCLIPATVLHERRQLSTDIDQPCSFALETGNLFAIAGVWDTWINDQGNGIESFAIVTVLVTPVLRTLFERMPVVLTDAPARDRWLHVSPDKSKDPVDLMRPLSSAQLREWKMMPGPVDMHLQA